MWRRVVLIVALIPVAMVLGLMILFIGLKGSANYAESLCFADLQARPAYGSYSMSGEIWPPSFECRIGGIDVPTLTIRHRAAGFAMLTTWVIVPATYVTCLIAGAWWMMRRRDDDRGAGHASA